MRIAVFGATGGTGRAVTKAAIAAGHTVTAFARRADQTAPIAGLTIVEGDVMHAGQVAPVLVGQDAVVISLGNSQNAFALRLGARRTTPRNVCEVGTRNILAALPQDRDTPVIVVGAFGTGATAGNLPIMFKLFYHLVLPEQMADKEKQAEILNDSTTPYTLIQPVALTDKPGTGTWTVSRDGSFAKPEVARADLAAFIVGRLEDGVGNRETMTFSG
ncbi:NAD(P)-dependent oxidoreductase [Loktanella fryxellensis]|nr:NAD(P)-binding oxidoreductase [Loktanella fryxellensis]